MLEIKSQHLTWGGPYTWQFFQLLIFRKNWKKYGVFRKKQKVFKITKNAFLKNEDDEKLKCLDASDGSGHGLISRTAQTQGILEGQRLILKDLKNGRLFDPKIGRFLAADFQPNLCIFLELFIAKVLVIWWVGPQKLILVKFRITLGNGQVAN